MKLVIAEKPSVAQAIAAALGVKNKKDRYMEGSGYLISWCIGHLVQLSFGTHTNSKKIIPLNLLPVCSFSHTIVI